MVEIPVDGLKAVFDLLVSRLPADRPTVTVPHDEFWSVPADQAYDPATAPHELTLGTLSDAWQHLDAMLADPDRAVGYGFVWLAEVLRAIGHETAS